MKQILMINGSKHLFIMLLILINISTKDSFNVFIFWRFNILECIDMTLKKRTSMNYFIDPPIDKYMRFELKFPEEFMGAHASVLSQSVFPVYP